MRKKGLRAVRDAHEAAPSVAKTQRASRKRRAGQRPAASKTHPSGPTKRTGVAKEAGRVKSAKRKRPRATAKKAKRNARSETAGSDAIRNKMLPAIAAAAGIGDARRLKRYIKGALTSGVPLRDIEEVIIQCYLFAGFPSALEGFMVLREVCDTPVKGRVKAARTSPELFKKRGEALCRTVYGAKYGPLRESAMELHPDLWNWMILEGYGKVLSRPPLPPAQRELCIIACLVVTGWNRQLRSHVHGALNVGCTPESIIEAVRTAGYVAGRWPLQWGLSLAREEIAKAAPTASWDRGRPAPRSGRRPSRRARTFKAETKRKASRGRGKTASRKRG